VTASEGQASTSIDFGGVKITFLHSDPAGPYSLIEWDAPAGTRSPPVHVHHHTEEGFYVLSGTYAFVLDGVTIEANAGSHVLVPSGHPHTFWNAGSEPARCLIVTIPPGLEGYFRELADRLASAESEEAAAQARQELSAVYDTQMVLPRQTFP
jgi:mannose-6-phosphate isomerase-like protein (cupin superfamily)